MRMSLSQNLMRSSTIGGRRRTRRKKKISGDGIANPLLDADSLFDDDGGIDLSDETLDVEGAMDDLESALETSDSTAPKWHKTT